MTEEEARRTGLPLVTGVVAGGGEDDRPDLPPSAWPAVYSASDGEEPAPVVRAQDPALGEHDHPIPLPTDEELVGLHERFDRIEATLKGSLTVASLHARFDRLEAWLAQHFTTEGDSQ